MKKKTKVLVLALCAILIVGTTMFATIAYLNDKDTVENTFTIGKVDISLDEAKVDEYGTADTQADRVKGNEYKLIPGHTYTKDPTVHFAAGSEASYLFVKVENGLSAIEAASDASYKTIADQMTANGWTALDGADGVYYKTVDANEGNSAVDYAIFTEIKISGDADDTTLASYKDAKITVTSYAIQQDGLADVATAWAQFSD